MERRSDIKDQGVLLRLIETGSGSAIADVFLRTLGVVTIGIRGFSKSKKRRAEVDYFRLLDVSLSNKGEKWHLKDVHTAHVWRNITESWQGIQTGYMTLQVLHKVLPHSHPESSFYDWLMSFFQRFSAQYSATWYVYFLVHIVQYLGVFDPLYMLEQSLTERERKIVIYALQADPERFSDHIMRITPEEVQRIQKVLERLLERH